MQKIVEYKGSLQGFRTYMDEIVNSISKTYKQDNHSPNQTEGQIVEQMIELLREILECERKIREAEEAIDKVKVLKAKFKEIASQY